MNEKQLRDLFIEVHTQFTALAKTPDALSLFIHKASLKSEDPKLIELAGSFMVEVGLLPTNKAGKHIMHVCAENVLDARMGRDCNLNTPFYRAADAIKNYSEEALENERPVWAVIALENGWKPMDEIT